MGALDTKENSATELVGLLSESEEFAASLVPLGLGLLIAARR